MAVSGDCDSLSSCKICCKPPSSGCHAIFATSDRLLDLRNIPNILQIVYYVIFQIEYKFLLSTHSPISNYEFINKAILNNTLEKLQMFKKMISKPIIGHHQTESLTLDSSFKY